MSFPARTAFGGQKARFFGAVHLGARLPYLWGAPLPERYTATSIGSGGPAVVHQGVTWPDPEMVEFPVLKEILPVYSGWLEIQGRLLFKFPLPEGELILSGSLRFQACSQPVCEPPQTVTCSAAHASTFSDFRT